MNWRNPGPVVGAVIVAELVGLWVVAALKWFYGVELDPIDVRINMLLFVGGVAWWTEVRGR